MGFNAEDRLGPVIQEHQPKHGSYRAYARVGWVIVGIALAAGLLAVGQGLFAYQTYGPLAVERWASPAATAAVALALIGLGFLLVGRRRARMMVRQHARGLVVERGRRGSSIPWDEIKHVHTSSVRYGPTGLPWGRQDELVLVTRDGRRYRLNQALTDFDELVAAVKQGAYPTLLDAYTRAFNHGQSLPFGPLEIRAEGIHNGRKTLRWSDVGEARLEQGWLVVGPADRRAGPHLRYPARAVPNVDLCLQLIQELTTRP